MGSLQNWPYYPKYCNIYSPLWMYLDRFWLHFAFLLLNNPIRRWLKGNLGVWGSDFLYSRRAGCFRCEDLEWLKDFPAFCSRTTWVLLLLKNSPFLCPTLHPASRRILREERSGREGNGLSITWGKTCCSVSEENMAWLESEGREGRGNLGTSGPIWRTVQDFLF